MATDKRISRRARERVLQSPEQRTPGLALFRPDVREEAAPDASVSVQLLVEFTRALIRLSPSPDGLSLAMRQARGATGASDEECSAMMAAVRNEAAQSPWAKDFF